MSNEEYMEALKVNNKAWMIAVQSRDWDRIEELREEADQLIEEFVKE